MNDKAFQLALDRLNAIGDRHQPWQLTEAKKNHTDKFGQPIKFGEDYYKKSNGSAYGNDIKLSEKSIESFAYLFFLNTPQLINLADKSIEERNEELHIAVNSISI